MTKWARRRKLIITTGVFTVFLLIGAGIFFVFIMPEPEMEAPEIDEPLILWARSLETGTGHYHAIAHISSVGRDVYSPEAEYEFAFYNKRGELIATESGRRAVPSDSYFRIMSYRISLPEEPEFTVLNWQNESWNKGEVSNLPELEVEDLRTEQPTRDPRVYAIIHNSGFFTVSDIELIAEVYDSAHDNLIGLSRTEIDRLAEDERRDLTFTWPRPFETARRCEIDHDIYYLVSPRLAEDSEQIERVISPSVEELFGTVRIGWLGIDSDELLYRDVSRQRGRQELTSADSEGFREASLEAVSDLLQSSKQERQTAVAVFAEPGDRTDDGWGSFIQELDVRADFLYILQTEGALMEPSDWNLSNQVEVYSLEENDEAAFGSIAERMCREPSLDVRVIPQPLSF